MRLAWSRRESMRDLEGRDEDDVGVADEDGVSLLEDDAISAVLSRGWRFDLAGRVAGRSLRLEATEPDGRRISKSEILVVVAGRT